MTSLAHAVAEALVSVFLVWKSVKSFPPLQDTLFYKRFVGHLNWKVLQKIKSRTGSSIGIAGQGSAWSLTALNFRPSSPRFENSLNKASSSNFGVSRTWTWDKRRTSTTDLSWLLKSSVLFFKEYVEKLQAMLEKYIVHLIALNFGNKPLARITDAVTPRLPVGDPLVASTSQRLQISFSPLCVSMITRPLKHLVSCLLLRSGWVLKRNSKSQSTKWFFPTLFSACTEWICQALDCGLDVLQLELAKDGVQLKNLYLYSVCAANDQKNTFFLCHISDLATLEGRSLPVRYFQRRANHNKFDFDSEGVYSS